jgi:segregation and condensation protein A
MTVALPTLNLPAFEGPLDLLLHLVREHKLDIADIPIVQVTEQYLNYLAEMEERNLTLAGEFFVMAATLLEIKSRMLLPIAPKEEDEQESIDPREEIAQRLFDYEKFKALVPALQELEHERSKLFFRGQADYSGLYELPVQFGTVSASALLSALSRVLERSENGEQKVTSVRRHRLTLRLAMHRLLYRVLESGVQGLDLHEALTEGFPTRLDIVMLFLALLELLKQGEVAVEQAQAFAPIRIFAVAKQKESL